jgi:hypothetical protein
VRDGKERTRCVASRNSANYIELLKDIEADNLSSHRIEAGDCPLEGDRGMLSPYFGAWVVGHCRFAARTEPSRHKPSGRKVALRSRFGNASGVVTCRPSFLTCLLAEPVDHRSRWDAESSIVGGLLERRSILLP